MLRVYAVWKMHSINMWGINFIQHNYIITKRQNISHWEFILIHVDHKWMMVSLNMDNTFNIQITNEKKQIQNTKKHMC